MSLQADISRFVAKAKTNQAQVFQAVALKALERVKELTPVVTGNLRASWGLYLRPEDVTPVPAGSPGPIATFVIGDAIFLGTAVAYAMRVEVGFNGTDSLGRTYHTHGRGMVQQTMRELPQIAVAVVREWSGR